jgi:hypothetical protein
VDSYTVFTNTTRRDLYGNQHCGTRHETFYVEVVPAGPNSITRTNSSIPGDTTQYTMFVITYDADPLVATMASTLEAPDNVPPGVSVLVKSGPLVLLSDLHIEYTKKPGVRTTLGVARDRIHEYLKSAGYPDVFRQTVIHDIMKESGAERVASITCDGYVYVSAATRRMHALVTDSAAMAVTADWHAQSSPIVTPAITSASAIVPALIVDEDNGGQIELWAATGRTVRYHADKDNITFTELQ